MIRTGTMLVSEWAEEVLNYRNEKVENPEFCLGRRLSLFYDKELHKWRLERQHYVEYTNPIFSGSLLKPFWGRDNYKVSFVVAEALMNGTIEWYQSDSDFRIVNYNEPVVVTISPWVPMKKKPMLTEHIFLQSEEQLDELLKQTNPYGREYFRNHDIWGHYYPQRILLYPQLEQLHKLGYRFAENIAYDSFVDRKDEEYFKRLCQEGTDLKSIFKTTKPVYTTLKEERSLELWDEYRRMVKMGRISDDTLQDLYSRNYRTVEIKEVGRILSRTYNGKQVFSFDSLINYLGRLDQYEAISGVEALQILDDYLFMCQQLQMEPRVDGDSLKREHDIAARLVRQQRNEILAREMSEACEKLQVWNYEGDKFFVRGVQSYDDLLDEAKQQHNCVASYANRISHGESKIYVLREKATPNRSLVTIEINPKGTEIRQKYLAYNQPIRNKAISDFIDEWLAHIRKVKSRVA